MINILLFQHIRDFSSSLFLTLLRATPYLFALAGILFFAPQGALAGEKLRIGGSGTDLATMKLLCATFAEANPDIQCDILSSLGSGGGVRAVKAGKVAIGLTSRPLKESEQSADFRAIQYAKTPLILTVSKSNPVESITLKQLRDFYDGKQLHWPDGSVARPILRPASDSDTLLLEKIFPELKSSLATARLRRGVPIAATDQDAADLLNKVPGAFGTTSLSLILAEQHPLKPLILDNKEPSLENVSRGIYPLFKELYFVVPVSLPSSVERFLLFVKSGKGQEILTHTGHVIVEFSLK